MEQKQFSNLNRRSPKEHFCEIILKSGHWPRRTYHLKVFLCFSFGGHYVERSGTILTILVEEHPRNISVKSVFFSYFLLWWPFCAAERNHFNNFDRGSPKEHLYKLF